MEAIGWEKDKKENEGGGRKEIEKEEEKERIGERGGEKRG